MWLLLENQKLKQLAPDEVDTFDSSCIYLVEHAEHGQSSLYSWSEGTLYIWVGAKVEERKNAVFVALGKARSIGTSSKMVCYCMAMSQLTVKPENLAGNFIGQCVSLSAFISIKLNLLILIHTYGDPVPNRQIFNQLILL